MSTISPANLALSERRALLAFLPVVGGRRGPVVLAEAGPALAKEPT